MTDPRLGWLRPLGATGLTVSAITVGAGTFGGAAVTDALHMPDPSTVSLVTSVLQSRFRSLDTANGYGGGRSEKQIGFALAAAGGKPDDFLVITKVDPRGRDYSGDRVRASVEESCDRLGLPCLPLVQLHDPEYFPFETITRSGGAIDTLFDLKQSGRIGHIGLAGGPSPEMRRYLDLGLFEVLLVHSRFTLLDRSADALLQHAADAGLGIVNAAIFGGGILAAPDNGIRSYGYRPASDATLHAVQRMSELCRSWRTDLATAALQFSLHDPRIDSTIVGISSATRLQQLEHAAESPLPEPFWEELGRLVPTPDNWLDAAER